MNRAKKTRWFFLFVPILPVLISCATTVTFNVEHPPLVDLRNVSTITVIPFEWNSIREYEYLSSRVTYALIDGLRRGSINFVDPYMLSNTHERNYRSYADVYILGRVVNVRSYSQDEMTEETDYRGEKIRRVFTTRTVAVDIEYTYIRSADNEKLRFFSKTEISSATFERSGGGRHSRRRGRYSEPFQQGSRAERIAVTAAVNFSDSMAQELGPWTTTERRKLKGSTAGNRRLSDAKKHIRQNRYREALDLYNEIFEQTGDVSAGYNTAILLEANQKFTKALELLENLYNRTLESGKKSPSYITREIDKLKRFIDGFMVLESYRGDR